MKIIKGKNFILRHAKLSDAENIYKYQQDKETRMNFMSVPKSVDEVKRDIVKKRSNSESFVIDVNGKAIGKIGIHDLVKGHKGITSSWVAKDFRGKGIGTQAHKIFLDYVFKKYKLKRVQGNVRSFNKASARMLEKSGYKLEGILRKNKLKYGKFMDDMVYAIVR